MSDTIFTYNSRIPVLSGRVPYRPESFDFLLDTYSGAAAAFSLRKLSSSYSGNCVKVRRDLDNATQDIGFVNNVLDTSSLLSFVGSNNGYVETWYDQSGNNNHLLQSTDSTQPQIVSNGVIYTINSLPRVEFQNFKKMITQNAVFSAGSSNYSFFLVGLADGDNIAAGFFQGGDINTNESVGLCLASNDNYKMRHLWWANDLDTVNNFRNQHLLVSGFWDSPTRITDINDIEYVTETNSGKNTALSPLQVGRLKFETFGSSPGWQEGYTQELIIYNYSLLSNLSDIKTRINTYYSIY